MFNNSTFQQLYRVCAAVCLCLVSNNSLSQPAQSSPAPAPASEAAIAGYGSSAGMPAGNGGPLTSKEQVDIYDAALEKGAAKFDTIINVRPKRLSKTIASASSSTIGEDTANIEVESTKDAVPQNTGKYPPPTNIPNGNNDDVVARQLREAAMREPDPAVRERLWDEYRKYTGLEK
jgi:hypothetical protein